MESLCSCLLPGSNAALADSLPYPLCVGWIELIISLLDMCTKENAFFRD